MELRARMRVTLVGVLALGACCVAVVSAVGSEPPRTGPETEKRFPPLKVPTGLKATLFACDPLIEYPSAVAAGPRPGSILVAVDYLSGLGTEIVRRDEIRQVEDTDGDGYADRARRPFREGRRAARHVPEPPAPVETTSPTQDKSPARRAGIRKSPRNSMWPSTSPPTMP